MGIVAPSAHDSGNIKSAIKPNSAKVSQKIFRCTLLKSNDNDPPTHVARSGVSELRRWPHAADPQRVEASRFVRDLAGAIYSVG